MKQWYEELFENYGLKYDNKNFTQGTIGECDFIEKGIEYNKDIKILDIGLALADIQLNYPKKDMTLSGLIYQNHF
jgi:hypothetical protein